MLRLIDIFLHFIELLCIAHIDGVILPLHNACLQGDIELRKSDGHRDRPKSGKHILPQRRIHAANFYTVQIFDRLNLHVFGGQASGAVQFQCHKAQIGQLAEGFPDVVPVLRITQIFLAVIVAPEDIGQ